jgi:hypothetical protein
MEVKLEVVPPQPIAASCCVSALLKVAGAAIGRLSPRWL